MILNAKHLLNNKKRKVTLLVSLLLIFCVGVAVTCAFMLVPTESYEYRMKSAEVVCEEVVQIFDHIDALYPTSVKVTNTGNTMAYVRVKLVAMFRNKEADHLHWTRPVFDDHYTITLKDGWVFDSAKEYIYYQHPVSPGNTTPELIESIILTGGNALAPENFRITFDVLTSAVQAEPDGRPAEEAWGVDVDSDGVLTPNN